MPEPPAPAADPIAAALKQIVEARLQLSRADARALLDSILDAPPSPELQLRLAALLGALTVRGESEQELAGFVDALRARSTPIPLTPGERELLVDTCGTGGDLSGTFNISTAAALVAAAAGAWVAKHGNRAVTSRAGSADVLEALGIRTTHTPESAAESLRRHRFAFLSAPSFQPAMAAVLPIRRALGVRTAFNIVGPMTNPAGASAQVLGVYAPHLVPTAAAAVASLNTRHAFVVHGTGLDEFSIAGPTLVAEVIEGEFQVGNVLPDAFGLPTSPLAALAGGDAQQNAAIVRAIFAGQPGPPRDVVVMNAGAVLVTANLAEDFLDGARLAQRTIDSGAVTALLEALAK